MTDQPILDLPQFRYRLPDVYDGAEWNEMDIRDLRTAVIAGSTLEQAAAHLCRSGTIDDVKRKAAELGLSFPP